MVLGKQAELERLWEFKKERDDKSKDDDEDKDEEKRCCSTARSCHDGLRALFPDLLLSVTISSSSFSFGREDCAIYHWLLIAV